MGRNYAGKIFGVGLLGLTVGAILGAFMAPKSGEENREDFMNWSRRMKHDLRHRLHETRDLTQDKYNSIVDDLKDKYAKMKYIRETELDDFAQELKNRWERIKDRWNEA